MLVLLVIDGFDGGGFDGSGFAGFSFLVLLVLALLVLALLVLLPKAIASFQHTDAILSFSLFCTQSTTNDANHTKEEDANNSNLSFWYYNRVNFSVYITKESILLLQQQQQTLYNRGRRIALLALGFLVLLFWLF